ncbi:MAG: hypothetical protein Q4C84_08200 [Bacillota bacterium]|nr:hypothetical protein [Bacillota bacterium]
MKNEERRKRQEQNYKRLYSLEKDRVAEAAHRAFHKKAYNVQRISEAAIAILKKC